MTEQFFSVEYAGRGDLFEKLAVWKEEKYRKLQGTYPVISLSLAVKVSFSLKSLKILAPDAYCSCHALHLPSLSFISASNEPKKKSTGSFKALIR